LDRAVELFPTHAAAYLYLSQAHAVRVRLVGRSPGGGAAEAWDAAHKDYETALCLNPRLGFLARPEMPEGLPPPDGKKSPLPERGSGVV
jgi:hypothetical protein